MVIGYGSIIEIVQRPENTKASKNKTTFFKVCLKCAMPIANMPCLDLFKVHHSYKKGKTPSGENKSTISYVR